MRGSSSDVRNWRLKTVPALRIKSTHIGRNRNQFPHISLITMETAELINLRGCVGVSFHIVWFIDHQMMDSALPLHSVRGHFSLISLLVTTRYNNKYQLKTSVHFCHFIMATVWWQRTSNFYGTKEKLYTYQDNAWKYALEWGIGNYSTRPY